MTSITLDLAKRRALPGLLPTRRTLALVARKMAFAAIVILALVPVVTVLADWFSTAMNVAYWDEIDSVLPFLLQLDARMNPERFVGTLFAVTNEHRTVTSRLLFALSYGFTGTVNFVWIGAIGNAFIVGACALLVWAVRSAERRLQMGVVLGFAVFHLGSYENFLWSGSSIDHFQVIALAFAALVVLGNTGCWPFRIAAGCAVLSSFTLAHGLMVWPAGAIALWRERRWADLAWWCAAAAVTLWVFLSGFYWNTGHLIGSTGPAMARLVLLFWLELLGAPLAFGHASLAIGFGALLVTILVVRSLVAPWPQVRAILPCAWFLVAAALLISFGRAEFAHGHVFSRYFVVGGLAWALVLFDAMTAGPWRDRPLIVLGAVAPLLAALNFAENVHYRADAATFVEHRDRAALRYRQYGEDGHAPVTLHPDPKHATELLRAAERAGVYRVPAVCVERKLRPARPSERISYYVDELTVDARAAYVSGWVVVRGEESRRGSIHLVLRSAERSAMFTVVSVRRPDVANAFHNADWEWSGFRFVLRRERLPPAEYRIGFLVDGDPAEVVMTEHHLDLRAAGRALLAGGN